LTDAQCGLYVEPEGVSLAPLFDVEPALARPGVGTEFFLAMSVGPLGRLATLDNLSAAAAAFNLKEGEARDLTSDMQTRVRSSWRDVLGDAGFRDGALDVLAPSFGTGGECE